MNKDEKPSHTGGKHCAVSEAQLAQRKAAKPTPVPENTPQPAVNMPQPQDAHNDLDKTQNKEVVIGELKILDTLVCGFVSQEILNKIKPHEAYKTAQWQAVQMFNRGLCIQWQKPLQPNAT